MLSPRNTFDGGRLFESGEIVANGRSFFFRHFTLSIICYSKGRKDFNNNITNDSYSR